MSEDEKRHWQEKYSRDDYDPELEPSVLLTEWVDDRPPGRALDLACGTGRNALYLAERGFEVTAVDISPRALELAEQKAREKGLTVNWIAADLDTYAIEGQYDLIVISFFSVNKGMVLPIIDALKHGGTLLCENHMLPPSASEDEARKHRFHLRPGELRHLFPGLKEVRYEERRRDGKEGGPPSYYASLVAQKE